jgi:hypothetical protein
VLASAGAGSLETVEVHASATSALYFLRRTALRDNSQKLERYWIQIGSSANANGSESSSQAFGRAVSEVSEALLVPSARRVGVNLVVYPKSLRASSILEIEGQEELPR